MDDHTALQEDTNVLGMLTSSGDTELTRLGMVEEKAVELLDALDRMHGSLYLSENVRRSAQGLRMLTGPSLIRRDPADRADKPPE